MDIMLTMAGGPGIGFERGPQPVARALTGTV